MRSPQYSGDTRTLLCVNCDVSDTKAGSQLLSRTHNSPPQIASEDVDKYSLSASSSINSPKTTPPTDISPPPSPPFVLSPPSEEMLRRRAQSDNASQEIGNLMLKGYTMLADECPNSTCYGIPLVKPPGETFKECVVCKSRYNAQGGIVSSPPANNLSQSKASTNSKVQSIPQENFLRRSNYEPTLSIAVPTVPEESIQPYRASESSLNVGLRAALNVLERQLVAASADGDVTRIGDIAESISKVSKAIRDVSSLP